MSDTTRLENHPDGCQDFPGGHCHVLPMSEPLDPTTIMAAHVQDINVDKPWCRVCDEPLPCLPYRLAAALVDRDTKIAAIQATLSDGFCVCDSWAVPAPDCGIARHRQAAKFGR